jgi:hypothetical protein
MSPEFTKHLVLHHFIVSYAAPVNDIMATTVGDANRMYQPIMLREKVRL